MSIRAYLLEFQSFVLLSLTINYFNSYISLWGAYSVKLLKPIYELRGRFLKTRGGVSLNDVH